MLTPYHSRHRFFGKTTDELGAVAEGFNRMLHGLRERERVAAVEMRDRLRAWNTHREAAGLTPLRNGIGIHTGTVLAGNIGGADRLSYALVGDPVNLASRIQGLTKDFKADILISAATRDRLDGTIALEELPPVQVKGREEEVTLYRVA